MTQTIPDLAALHTRLSENDGEAKTIIKDPTKLKALVAKLETAANAAPADVSTDKKRKEIISLAATVARIKTVIDSAGKDMKAAYQENIKKVDSRRSETRDALDKIRDRIRQPVTEYEEAEAARKAELEALINTFNAAANIPFGSKSDDITAKLAEARAITISENRFIGGELEQIKEAQERALSVLEAGLKSAREAEEQARVIARQKAEIERMKAAEAEKAQQAATVEDLEQALTSQPQEPAAPSAPLSAQAAPVETPLRETMGSLMRAADTAGVPCTPRLAGVLADALKAGQIRHVKWEG
ncbi:MAG: hypothetical protein JKP96_06520 [Oceanicaulis sp.]|jgi:colicin import membrane protein|nr:hypothetical protein [Oceanicaulis sp.]